MSRETDESGVPAFEPALASRRRVLLTLGGMTLGAAAYGYGDGSAGGEPREVGTPGGDHPASPYHINVTTAVAAAVYPSAVAVDESFVERRVFGRVEPSRGHFEGVVAAAETVDRHAIARFGEPVSELPAADRLRVLKSMGVTEVHPFHDGTAAERVRYYLVNDLLFALFTSPASSEMTGIENPPGHPGGREAYQRGAPSR